MESPNSSGGREAFNSIVWWYGYLGHWREQLRMLCYIRSQDRKTKGRRRKSKSNKQPLVWLHKANIWRCWAVERHWEITCRLKCFLFLHTIFSNLIGSHESSPIWFSTIIITTTIAMECQKESQPFYWHLFLCWYYICILVILFLI